MDESKTLSIKIEQEEGGHVTLSSSKQDFYSVPVDVVQTQDFRGWLALMGASDCLKQTIHPQTFASLCRELVDQQKALHPEVRFAEKKTIKMRRT
jgi:hypothetical protein